MTSSEPNPNQVSVSAISFKDDQVNDLMNSIENKLSMLACQDSIQDFQSSKISSPKRQFMTATNQKRKKYKMNINELQTSNRKQTRESPSQLGQSRILSRINEMQHYYMDKIQQMSSKMANLQFQVENLNKLNHQIKNQNILLKQSLARKEKQQNDIINKKIEQLKNQLINKFSKQAEQHFAEHIKQMREINDQLLEQKGKRKYLQQQVLLIKNQKNSLEQFYRNLLENHRNMIRFDIQKSEKAHKDHINHEQVGNSKITESQSNIAKKKTKKKQSSNLSRRSEEMTKQQMIPFLQKGIQQLKDKLKIK